MVGCSQQQTENNAVVLAYVTSWSSVMPDPAHVTHINYAFGHVNETFDGVMINRPSRPGRTDDEGRATSEDRLRSIVELKKQKPSLKIMLSIGGWGSGRFSEMASDETNRLKFAADCQRVVLEFGLDGIDMDWEYPTSSSAGISSSPEDMDNFTLLMRDIRQAIGKDKLLTFASAANALYVDFKAVNQCVDFVNIMTYDMGRPPYHHAAFKPSEHTTLSVIESVDLHVEAGIPIHKLTLGLPFYGRGVDPIPNFLDYRNLINRNGTIGFINRNEEILLEGYAEKWDEEAQAPYWADPEGKIVLTFETPKSIIIKCEWLRAKGMLGAMYWEYNGNDDERTLSQLVYDGVMAKPSD
jgi:chitinase